MIQCRRYWASCSSSSLLSLICLTAAAAADLLDETWRLRNYAIDNLDPVIGFIKSIGNNSTWKCNRRRKSKRRRRWSRYYHIKGNEFLLMINPGNNPFGASIANRIMNTSCPTLPHPSLLCGTNKWRQWQTKTLLWSVLSYHQPPRSMRSSSSQRSIQEQITLRFALIKHDKCLSAQIKTCIVMTLTTPNERLQRICTWRSSFAPCYALACPRAGGWCCLRHIHLFSGWNLCSRWAHWRSPIRGEARCTSCTLKYDSCHQSTTW